MASWRVWVDPIIFEHSFARRICNLIQELLWTVHLYPRLPQTALLIANIFYFYVSLLIWIIISVQQITNILTIYLKRTDFYEYLSMKLPSIPINLMLYEYGDPRQYASVVKHFLRARVD